MKFLQKLGKSLMLPVAILPVAAILTGIGYWIESASGNSGNTIAVFLNTAGGAILTAIPLLFAIGVSIGMANQTDGTSALAGLVSWLVVTQLLDPEVIMSINGLASIDLVHPAYAKISNVFIGIICGLTGAFSYNKFKEVQLPSGLAFFSGKRCVAIVTGGISIVIAGILYFVWVPVFQGLTTFGEAIASLGALGAGIYGFFNRLLIPFGLHHALNSVFWFDIAGINDLGNFLNGKGVFGVTGQYMTGFFPVMMFGIPGAALAMYHTAHSRNKKMAAGLLLSASVASFLTGVTEPFEFAFMFLSPILYLIHAVFFGISLAISAILPVRMGFGFSGGFIDLILNWNNPLAENPWLIFVMGIAWFSIYYIVFRVLIQKFHLKTPGREDGNMLNTYKSKKYKENNFTFQAGKIIEGLGGKANISDIDSCITRLRIEVADMQYVAENQLINAGAKGVIKLSKNSLQIIVGLNAQFIANAIKNILKNQNLEEKDAILEKNDINISKTTIYAPAKGEFIALKDVPDATFANGIMGEGIAIVPSEGKIVAPFDGIIEQIFPAGHAVVIKSKTGAQVLIHIGLDTVQLKGEGFHKHVQTGDKVSKGDVLINMDLDLLLSKGYNTITPIVVVNASDFADFRTKVFKNINFGDIIIHLK
ncbi:MAG: N-acetylglucosamine-specific PTS transporter subunit IIBC [Bacteroidales bacterium]|jgi:PTS system N-acetylglucosamine-specific IIC component|nr:N-acetylglucosamine-specific PTS transporter subunit IIBC [Bacteroidales bacterium]